MSPKTLKNPRIYPFLLSSRGPLRRASVFFVCLFVCFFVCLFAGFEGPHAVDLKLACYMVCTDSDTHLNYPPPGSGSFRLQSKISLSLNETENESNFLLQNPHLNRLKGTQLIILRENTADVIRRT